MIRLSESYEQDVRQREYGVAVKSKRRSERSRLATERQREGKADLRAIADLLDPRTGGLPNDDESASVPSEETAVSGRGSPRGSKLFSMDDNSDTASKETWQEQRATASWNEDFIWGEGYLSLRKSELLKVRRTGTTPGGSGSDKDGLCACWAYGRKKEVQDAGQTEGWLPPSAAAREEEGDWLQYIVEVSWKAEGNGCINLSEGDMVFVKRSGVVGGCVLDTY